MTAERAPFALRADLIWRRIEMGQQRTWVAKDPMSRSFWYFSDQEYEILRLTDGSRSPPAPINTVSPLIETELPRKLDASK